MRRGSQSTPAAIGAGITFLVVCAGAHAQSWSFTRIADTSTIVPGTTSNFQNFGVPSIENGVVGLTGYRSFPTPITAGVYTGTGGSLTVVADHTTPVPGGTGNFTGFGLLTNSWPSLSDGAIAFHGEIQSAVNPTGTYLREGGQLHKVVDYQTAVPNSGGANFSVMGHPSLQNGRVAFVGWASGNVQRGVYSWQGGSLSVVADRSTPIPNGPGTFTDFFDCDLDQGQIVFSAEGTGLHRGIYLCETGGGLTRLYDTGVVVPGGTGGNFTGFARTALSHGHVAFWGTGGGTEGVYTDVNGQLQVLANHSTPPPGVSWAAFGGFSSVSIDQGIVAFDAISGGGAFSGVFSTHTGTLDKVLASGDLLDGRIVADTGIGAQAIDGDSIAISVSFTNGSYGIYMATIPAPGAMALLGAAGLLAARRRRC